MQRFHGVTVLVDIAVENQTVGHLLHPIQIQAFLLPADIEGLEIPG